MIDDSLQAEPYDPKGRRSEPLAIAADIVAKETLVADKNGRLIRYNGRHWERLTGFEVERLIFGHASREAARPARRTEIAQLVALKTAVDDLAWGRVADHELPCRAGVFDLRTKNLRPHSPDDFLEAVLPWDFDPSAECPTWLECLETWFASVDDARATALQEFAGYVLMPHARFKTALLLYGPGNTGKSEIVWVMRQLVGPGACCSLSCDAMDDARKRVVLRGKMLNVIAELSGKALFRDSGFKTLISTEEPVTLDPKFEHPEEYMPIAKHIIATNDLPRLSGRTREVFDRLLIIPMDRIVPDDKQDRLGLRRAVSEQMPGVFAWAVRGAEALLAREGWFTVPPGRDVILEQWRQATDPVFDWLSEMLSEEPGCRLPLAGVAERASACLRRSITVHEVGKAARELGLRVETQRPSPGANSVRCILDRTLTSPVQGRGQ